MQILIDLDYTLLDTDKFRVNIDENMDNLRDFLYPDALAFLKYAEKFGTPTLFSEGELDFQKTKIEMTGLTGIFGNNIKLYPSYQKLFDLEKMHNPTEVIVVDDKPDIIDQAISLGMKTIRINRGKYKDMPTKLTPLYKVNDLEEIIKKDLFASLH